MGIPVVSNVIGFVADKFDAVKRAAKETANPLEFFRTILDKIRGIDLGASLGNIGDKIKGVFSGGFTTNPLTGVIEWFQSGFEKIRSMFDNAAVATADGGRAVSGAVSTAGQAISNAFKFVSDNFTQIAGIGIVASLAFSLHKLAKTADALTVPFKMVGKVISTVSSTLVNLQKMAYKAAKYNNMIKIAVAVGILALAFKQFASVPSDKIAQAAGCKIGRAHV